jgi:uncharacterized protein YgiM (DUF1202 family)
MLVKLCPQCGYQLPSKAKRCHWCKSPVKKITALLIWILPVLAFLVLVAWFLSDDLAVVPLTSESPPVVQIIKTEPPVKKSEEYFSTIYVGAQVANLRKNPSLTSDTIKKLKPGQRLTQVNRSGDWLQVLADGTGIRPGWVHTSLVEKTNPLPKPTQLQVVKVSKTEPSENKPSGDFSTTYAKSQLVNVHKDSSLTSHTIEKISTEQQLTQGSRSSDWLQVLEDGVENKLGWVHSLLASKTEPLPKTTQPQVVKVSKTEPSINKPSGDFSTAYAKGQLVSLRKDPSLPSHTIKKISTEQQLTQGSRSSDWLQVLEDGVENKLGWVHSLLASKTEPLPKTTQAQVVKVSKTEPSINKPSGDFPVIYVRGQFLNLRKDPSLTSHTIRKLKKGQRLTQLSRSENWLQVLEYGAEDRPGWVHTSLVAKILPPPSIKAPSEQKAFKMFRISFDQYNTNIKKLKGMDFFNDVEYVNQGVIQITATDILLSAPKKYKEKYLIALMEMWLEVRETTQPATVRIVDKNGHLRLQEVQNQ